ncbi:MAG TPA: PEGA domain-containing protein [Kofleriaceae bacterium]|nr:PEGA domain-containing protein [Kofleriaceae bacterium]
MKIFPLAAALVCALATAARGEPDRRRRVAVLEYRGGSAELTGVGGRIAGLLRARTSLDVVDAETARAGYPALESDLSACGGRAGCVSRIGKRLGAAEVLLVGVGEFGDVILTLQRIDVDSGRALGRVAEALAAGARPGDDELSSWVERVLPRADFDRFGVIRIASSIGGARVVVGGVARGNTPLSPVRVPAPATYDILVAKPGFVDFRASVAVPPEAEVVVRADLARQSERPWYGRWWGLTIIGAAAVGAIATTIVLTSGGDDDVPVRVNPF